LSFQHLKTATLLPRAVALIVLYAFASYASASNPCGKQPSKAKVEQCYERSISEKKEALEEFHEAILPSTNIPQEVKLQVSIDYKSFIKNIFSFCPDSACVDSAMLEQIRDMHKEVSPYTLPQPAKQ
jgi:hypothetical protein